MTKIEKPNRAKLASLFHLISKTQKGFSDAIGESSGIPLTQQAVNRWLQRESVPAGWCIRIVKASGGRITAHDLRPDLFASPG